MSQIFFVHYNFCLQDWNIPLPTGIELEARPTPFVPTRLPPNEPLGNALEQVNNSLFVQMHYPLPQTLKVSISFFVESHHFQAIVLCIKNFKLIKSNY